MESVKKPLEKEREREAFIARLKEVLWELGRPPRKAPSQEAIGEAVGRRVGRKFSQGTVGGWLKGSLPADIAGMIALAQELGVDPGWLYFGEASKAPTPEGYTASAEKPSLGFSPTKVSDTGTSSRRKRGGKG